MLHTFDEEGSHLNTRSWFAGNPVDLNQQNALPGLPELRSEHGHQDTFAKLEEWIAELGEVKYHDIEAKLFQVVIADVVFGLVPALGDEENTTIQLQPSSTNAFYEPWDGEYYT